MMQTIKPYSEDLRRGIVRAPSKARDVQVLSRYSLFGVSLSSVKRYLRIAKRGASLEPRRGGGRPPKPDETLEKLLKEDVEERTAATPSPKGGASCRVHHGHGPERLYDSTVKWIYRKAALTKRLGFTRKNELLLWGRWSETNGYKGYLEGDALAREITPERLVFVDEEMATNISVHPLYALSPKG
jgi:hypothetical protein